MGYANKISKLNTHLQIKLILFCAMQPLSCPSGFEYRYTGNKADKAPRFPNPVLRYIACIVVSRNTVIQHYTPHKTSSGMATTTRLKYRTDGNFIH